MTPSVETLYFTDHDHSQIRLDKGMPNAAARRSQKAKATNTSPTPDTNGVNVVSTLTAGDFTVEELGDYEFTRQGAGRKREPSPFDDLVNDWAGEGTRRIPVQTQDEGKEVIKALQKACEYRNRGLTKRLEEHEDRGLVVVFKIDVEKAKRAPRKGKDESPRDTAELVDAAETE